MSEETDFSSFANGNNDIKKTSKRRKKDAVIFVNKKKKERLSIYICSDLKRKIKKLAERHNSPESSIVEQCLDKVLGDMQL